MKIKGILVTSVAPFENHIANGGEKLLGNMSSIKKSPNGHCYVSGQMQRHALFTALDRANVEYQEEYHIKKGSGNYTYVSNADGITNKIESDLRADMGGFMHTAEGIGSTRRSSPISVTPAIALETSKLGHDLLVCLDQKPNSKDNAIVSTEFSEYDEMRMNFFLDVTSLSIYKTYGYDENFHVNTTLYKFAPEAERKRRAKLFLEATRFLNDYANQARNAVCGEPQKVFIVFDTTLSRKASRYFKASETEKTRIKEELEYRGAKYFYGDDTDDKEESVLQAYKAALLFLEKNELYSCDVDDEHVKKFEFVESVLKENSNKNEEDKNKNKRKSTKKKQEDTSDSE